MNWSDIYPHLAKQKSSASFFFCFFLISPFSFFPHFIFNFAFGWLCSSATGITVYVHGDKDDSCVHGVSKTIFRVSMFLFFNFLTRNAVRSASAGMYATGGLY